MASFTGSASVASFSCIRPTQATSRMASLNAVSFSVGKSFSSAGVRTSPSHICFAATPETVDKVCAIVRKQLAIADDKPVTGETSFAELGADSLDTVEIVMGLEEEFGIAVEEENAQTIVKVQDAADLIEDLVAVKK